MAQRKSRKAKLKSFRLFNDTWCYRIDVRIGGTRQAAEDFLRNRLPATVKVENLDGKLYYSNAGAVLHATIGGEPEISHVIWFQKTPGAALLSHEAFHSACWVLESLGIKLSRETEEAFAYLIQWTVKAVADKCW